MRPHEVILVGAGGHALSLAEFAGDEIFGYLDVEKTESFPYEWLGNDEEAGKYAEAGKYFHISYVYSGLPWMERRGKIIKGYEEAGARFKILMAPSSIVTPGSEIGEGSAVMNGAIVNRARLGRHVIVNSGAIVEHDCEVGDNTFIGPGAVIGGFTKIGANCFIGLGARVGNGLTIGDNITVAMGAVVTKDLKEPGIYHGVPMKRFKMPGSGDRREL